MGEKTANDILSEITQQICSPKFRHTHTKQSCIKNCDISIFGFLAFFVVVLFWNFNMEEGGESG